MGKAARIRRDREAKEASALLARGTAVTPDPEIGGIEVPAGLEGQKQAAKEMVAAAKERGCTCANPTVTFKRLLPGMGQIMLGHEDDCPFLREIKEQAAAE
jgi:3-methyladenine DNA glycosylase Tag